ncbi:MAG: hypothetical protein J7L08_01680 [Candidatus Aenigmarchaeota archaeon]|nr:hypothetical protein [Candidatus Aenigmarchaeota archaeon]
MHYLTYSIAGVFLLDEDKKIVDFSLFKNDPKEIIEKTEKLKNGEIIDELEEIMKRIKDNDIVTDIPIKSDKFNINEIKMDKNPRELAIKSKFVKNDAEYNKLISKIQILETKSKIKTTEKMDKVAMQVISAIEDLTDISNRYSERLHEWYGLYYPELERKIRDNKKYSKIVSEKTKKPISEESVGMELDEDDLKILKKFAEQTKNIFELQEDLEKYLEVVMEKVAPNTAAIAGSNIGAKLILLAGGLERLAKLPSSTIQLLGAEKALFRFIKSKNKTRPPKYGILFLHPEVTNAPDHLKGKTARAIASEISMAAKTDFYAKEDKTEKYKEELKKRLKEIKKKN